MNINGDELSFYHCSIPVNKCSGSCNNIKDPYAKLCVADVSKNINVKVFNLMSRASEARHIEWNETCKCKCRLHPSICNNKQHWNKDKCRCECQELIDKGICDKGFIWNPSHCEWECDKLCSLREYLDYENYQCRKTLIEKLVEKFSENIDENEMVLWDFKWLRKSMQFLYNIHSIICHRFFNNHWH